MLIEKASRYAADRRAHVLLATVVGALLCALVVAPGVEGQTQLRVDKTRAGEAYVAGELLVVYEQDAYSRSSQRLPAPSLGKVVDAAPPLGLQALSFPNIKAEDNDAARRAALAQAKEELAQDPNVATVEYNFLGEYSFTPDDTLFGQQYGLTKIRAPKAWDTVQGSGTVIGIIDSGIDDAHPDLKAKILDQVDFANDDDDAEDDIGHGTAVAGVAAAVTDNGAGVAGACPECKLLIVKNGENRPTLRATTFGIYWSADLGAEVVNLSLGGFPNTETLRRAVNETWRRGVVVVAAAGNDNVSRPSYPAAYANALSVSATDRRDERAPFSNYGGTIDVAAPGVDIVTTDVRGSAGFLPVSYAAVNGTSFSAPFVSGAAALLADRGLSVTALRDRLESTAVDLGPGGKDQYYGNGRIDVAAAVSGKPSAPPPTPPPGGPNKAPKIKFLSPDRGNALRNRKPKIRVRITDDEELKRSNMTLNLGGDAKSSFKYKKNGVMSFKPKKGLAAGEHTVRVTVTDGGKRRVSKERTFTVEDWRPGEGTNGRPGNLDWPFSMFPDRYPFTILDG